MGVMLTPFQKEKILRHYLFGQISVMRLIYLFENNVAPGAERAAKVLADLMVQKYHQNLRDHNEGSQDETMHYTIRLSNNRNGSNWKGFHLRLDAKGVIFQITDDQRRDIGTIPGYVPPGAFWEPKDKK